ncbi:MAG: putative toxin-antitoxin system toxin component, PIN family [Caldilineaceae bacterium]|nr:putative toxin-antitoxin system toxin component, PIN family [Caldilineaceae bacterium]
MKVVLDTNVWVSALINPRGTPANIVSHAVEFDLATSEELLAELERVLRYGRIARRYQLTDEMVDDYLMAIRLDCEVLNFTHDIQVVQEDPDDNAVLACAVHAAADYIVSGDSHLIDLKIYAGIRILTPGEFLVELDRRA